MVYAVTDIETSGLENGIDEILTAHIILTDGVNLLSEKSFNFKPKRITNSYLEAYKIHKISIAQARKFNNKEDELNSLLAFVPDNSIMVCHSKKTDHYFDYGFLFMEFELYDNRLNFYKMFKHCLSTHTLCKEFTKLKKRDLKSVCLYYEVELDNHHDAKSDAIACFEVFRKMYSENKSLIEGMVSDF